MNRKKLMFVCLLFVTGLFHTYAYAQDVIALTNGKKFRAKIEEVTASEIKYRRFDDLEGPVKVRPKSDVFYIKYENGTKVIINPVEEKEPTAKDSTRQESTKPESAKQESTKPQSTNVQASENYAILHIYRKSPIGALVNYDLHIENEVICRVKNKWKETVKIDKAGTVVLWAKTESKKELPITVEFGKEYYIRCSVVMGVAVGRPKLELVDEETGKQEMQLIKVKNKK